MNEHALLHIPNSNYCFAVDKNTVGLRLRVAKGEKINKVEVVYAGKYEIGQKQFSKEMQLTYTDRLFDYYTINIALHDVRFVYVFCLSLASGTVCYYSEDGITCEYDFKFAFYNAFQLPYINQIDLHNKVDWSKNAVFYQIFVDRFNIGDKNKNMDYINLKWGDIPNPKSYAGGDIKGVINNIDYIKSLGVNTIYLTPIFKAESNHKYNISDYKMVDEQFGTNKDLQNLVEIAHKKNMKIVLDAVFNHCSDTMNEFIDVKQNGKDSKFFDWFMINGDKVIKEPCNYETFGACDYMPKLNTSNLEVQDFLLDIALFWIDNYNIDGWRLDVSDEVSHNFWKKFRLTVKNKYPNVMIIGENWHDAYPFLHGDEYDSIMNYAFTKACLDVFATNRFNAEQFANKLNELLMRNTDVVNSMMLNLLDSHDTFRFLTEVKCNEDKLIGALAVMYFYIGMPMIYYGTENNMLGAFDPDCRRTFDWELSKIKNKTKSSIKFLSSLKNDGLLSSNYIQIVSANGVLSIKRKLDEKDFIELIINIDNQTFELENNNKQILFSNLLENNILKQYGFVVIE